jgi:hypothetical protein
VSFYPTTTTKFATSSATADWVVDELRKIGFANMADYMTPTPRKLKVAEMIEKAQTN